MSLEEVLRSRQFSNFPNIFRKDMADHGFVIIEPDGKTFRSFNQRRWMIDSFLACKDDTIYVPLVHARKWWNGHFTRLVQEIRDQGLHIAVVAPLGPMCAILENWGFEKRREYFCSTVEDVWHDRPA